MFPPNPVFVFEVALVVEFPPVLGCVPNPGVPNELVGGCATCELLDTEEPNVGTELEFPNESGAEVAMAFD
jgi:hypothetical protein